MRRQTSKVRRPDSCEWCGAELVDTEVRVNINHPNAFACIECKKNKDFPKTVIVHPVEKA